MSEMFKYVLYLQNTSSAKVQKIGFNSDFTLDFFAVAAGR